MDLGLEAGGDTKKLEELVAKRQQSQRQDTVTASAAVIVPKTIPTPPAHASTTPLESNQPPRGSTTLRTQTSVLATASHSISYSFEVGEQRTPHLYKAEVNADGTVKGQAYSVEANGQLKPAELLQVQKDTFDQFAQEDVTHGRIGENLRLTPRQNRLMADAHAASILKDFATLKGAADQALVRKTLENHAGMVNEWIQSHHDEARGLMANPDYMAAAQSYRHDHPTGDALSATLGQLGVPLESRISVRSNPVGPG